MFSAWTSSWHWHSLPSAEVGGGGHLRGPKGSGPLRHFLFLSLSPLSLSLLSRSSRRHRPSPSSVLFVARYLFFPLMLPSAVGWQRTRFDRCFYAPIPIPDRSGTRSWLASSSSFSACYSSSSASLFSSSTTFSLSANEFRNFSRFNIERAERASECPARSWFFSSSGLGSVLLNADVDERYGIFLSLSMYLYFIYLSLSVERVAHLYFDVIYRS